VSEPRPRSRVRRAIAPALAILALSGTILPARAQDPAGLQVQVSKVRSSRGHVRVDLCAQAEFLKDCVHGGAAPAVEGTTMVTVPGLPPGVYAVQAYHDENDNHEVDRRFGIPKEGVGFSNDPMIRVAPPSFGSAAFSYPGGPYTVRVRLRHYLGS
jgi:uncharacterized protein (DUF2141 family)